MVKSKLKNIIVDVSGHGYGHLGQIAPVISELMRLHPSVHVILRSSLVAHVIQSTVDVRIDHDEPPPEATLVMRTPTEVDIKASCEAYRILHAKWDEHLDRETTRLSALSPNLLIANVPYSSLAAAKRLGIPTVALCSLNWLDIYRHYCGHMREAAAISQTIKQAYNSADIFLQPRPHMPMSDLPNRQSVGPVARIGRKHKTKIRKLLGLTHHDHTVLVTFGGIQLKRFPPLPNISGIHWIASSDQAITGPNVTNVRQLNMKFIDILASCDAVVTKVGYGTFVEAACNGVGLVSSPRPDWPETDFFIDWAKRNANFALAEGGLDNTDDLNKALSAVLKAPSKTPTPASGNREAAEIIAGIADID